MDRARHPQVWENDGSAGLTLVDTFTAIQEMTDAGIALSVWPNGLHCADLDGTAIYLSHADLDKSGA